MTWRRAIFLACSLVLSVGLLGIAYHASDPQWLTANLSAAPGSDGILWQVQTTFLSVGFAGLAIAAQLFAEAPIAIGAARERVLEYIGAGWFVGVGLVANAVIAIETIWLPSELGVFGVALVWFVPTVALLVVSTVRLVGLFGNPSRLDEVVRISLAESLSNRLVEVSRKYSVARKQLDGLVTSGWSHWDLGASAVTLRVPVPHGGLVVKTINPNAVKRALDALGPRVQQSNSTGMRGLTSIRDPKSSRILSRATAPGSGKRPFALTLPTSLAKR